MATIKLGAMFTQIAGKVGGSVFQRSKVGIVMKNTPAHTLINSDPTSAKLKVVFGGRVLQIFALIASLWRALSFANRQTWIAGAVNFPFKNKFGDAYTGSGFQVFMSLNGNLLQNGFAHLNVCPLPAELTNPGELTLTHDPATGIRLVAANNLPADYAAIVKSCVKQSAGKNFVKGRSSRIMNIVQDGAVDYFVNDGYIETFGANTNATGTYWFEVKYLNLLTGQMSIPSFGYITVD